MLAWNGKPLYYNNGFINYGVNYNPLNLPPYTIRVRTYDGREPSGAINHRITVNNVYDNVYDVTVTANETNWSGLFSRYVPSSSRPYFDCNVTDVLGANSTNVVNMGDMFFGVSSLSCVNLFDTSNVTIMDRVFAQCRNLSSIPEGFNTSNVSSTMGMFAVSNLTATPNIDTKNNKNFGYMFEFCHSLKKIKPLDYTSAKWVYGIYEWCENAEEGISSTYNTLKDIPAITAFNSNYQRAFSACGVSSQHGSAELAQVPRAWGGTAP